MSIAYPEIDEVIKYIHEHLDEPLTLQRVSNYAAYSPYHFTRIFKERIGVPPHYYISSIRLQKAKDLLLTTNLSVRDIGMEVGQQSLGTFTTRFTQRVGLSPAQFRQSANQVGDYLDSLQQLTDWKSSHSPILTEGGHVVQGTIKAVVPFHGVILVGLFPKPIPEGLPVYGTLLSSLGEYSFQHVHPGIYYLLATAVSWEMAATDILLPHTTLRAKSEQAVTVKTDADTLHQHLTLHEPRIDDPPILISLPLLMKKFLIRSFQHSNR
ncbi:helix-turn-helix domain-containing protein [Virgibacillus kimchii]